MTIESLGRKGGPKPGELGPAAGRHGRRPQPETRVVPTARPKPGPPRTPPGSAEARRAVPQPPPPSPRPQPHQSQRAQGQGQGKSPNQGQGGQNQQGQAQGPEQGPAQSQGPQVQTQTQARVGEAKPARPGDTQGPRDRGQPQNQQRPRGRGDGKQDSRGDRSLYDGGSPSANRLGPGKAMRARDVSRPRDW